MLPLYKKKLFLFDMDGTLWLGDRLFDGTMELLSRIRNMGARYLFVTNNSSTSAAGYVKKLARLGIASVRCDFLTSTYATSLYIKKNCPDKTFFAVGTPDFISEMREYGISVTEEITDGTDGVILSNDTTINFHKLECACALLRRGVTYIATNPDWLCPAEGGYLPDCGSFAFLLEKATGRAPVFIGKPNPDMLTLAIARAGVTPEETVMVGDRMYTDIASGVRAGIDTVFVLSGEGTAQDAEASDFKPTYIMKDIKELSGRLGEKATE